MKTTAPAGAVFVIGHGVNPLPVTMTSFACLIFVKFKG